MARVPVVGRLVWTEYIALIFSLVLLFVEVPIRIITLLLPQPVIQFCYNWSKTLFNRLSSPSSIRARSKDGLISYPIANASDFTEICALAGYQAEEHVVQTADGYLLGIHRLPYKKGDQEKLLVNAGPGSITKPVVYLHHGLLMNSEVWVCITEEARCLPFALVEQGYDVWLGNNRGNKYSKKSTRFSPSSPDFWDFSMDQFAFHDIPDSIDYILGTVSQPSLSYIGFSQGTAQAFATLSIHPGLNEKINVFIALAPAMAPSGLSNGIVDSLVKASPHVLFLAFGRKSILSSTTFWQSILYPPLFVRVIDMCLFSLFAWSGRNISPHQKLAAYPHMYSFTSTKSVVHWFQVIRNRSFQMYDDDSSRALSVGASDRYYKVAKFPTRNIKTPIVLVYGGSDSLVDIRAMLRELPKHTMAFEIGKFEHLDFLWARSVDKLVFPHVFDALRYYSPANDGPATAAARNSLARRAAAAGFYLAGADKARWRLRTASQSISSYGEDQDDGSSVVSILDTPTRVEKKGQSAAEQARELQYHTSAPQPPCSPTSTTIDTIPSRESIFSSSASSSQRPTAAAPEMEAHAHAQAQAQAQNSPPTHLPSQDANGNDNNITTVLSPFADSKLKDLPNTSLGNNSPTILPTPTKKPPQKDQAHHQDDRSSLFSHLWPPSRSKSKSKSQTRSTTTSSSTQRSRAGSTSSSQASVGHGVGTGTDTSTGTGTTTMMNTTPPPSSPYGSGGGGGGSSAPRFSNTGIKIGVGRPSISAANSK